MGMHSNDARGATITEVPTDPSTKLTPSPLLVRTEGAEVGVRSKAIAGLDTSISLFILNGQLIRDGQKRGTLECKDLGIKDVPT